MIVNGFCKEVFRELPMEFAVEAQKLLGVSLEGSVGYGLRVDPSPRLEGTPRPIRRTHVMLLEIKNLTRASTGKEILKGIDLTSAGRGPRHHGPERLGQEHAGQRAGRPEAYEVTGGEVPTRARTCSSWTRGARPRGLFLAFQYPVEIPGVSNATSSRPR
jgi:hypothetical protein